MPKWIEDLNAQVIERDEAKCIECRAPAKYPPHHIVPRSRGKKHSPKLWRIENMACVCLEHHDNTVPLREKLLKRMFTRYNYDMAWVKEFGIPWEEVNSRSGSKDSERR